MEDKTDKGFRDELEAEIEIRLLEGSSGSHQIIDELTVGAGVAERGALNFLLGNGLIASVGGRSYVLTPEGWAFIDRRKHPRWSWMKRNWFPVLVAMATVVAQLGAAALNAWWST